MAYSRTFEGIVLRVHDVGEADRFCILLTRETGLLAARARAVRKPRSRLGGSLLPLQYLRVELRELSGGHLITGARLLESAREIPVRAFAEAAQGIELLLSLIQEGEPLPEIFDATLLFLRLAGRQEHVTLAYTFRLLYLLGFLPEASRVPLGGEHRQFFAAARDGELLTLPILSSASPLHALSRTLLADHLRSPLRSPGVSVMLC